MKVETILVPTDFSEDAHKAAQTAAELAKVFDARVVLLHAYHMVVPMASPMGGGVALPDAFYQEIRKQATTRVEAAAKELAETGVTVTGKAVADPPSMAALNEAESLPAQLIVMGTRGLSGLKHVLLGSVAERVIRNAPCPVLTVKSDA